MTAPSIVVVGDIATDVVVRLMQPLSLGSDATAAIKTTGGGSGANVAAWLGYAGSSVSFVGAVGDDAFGRERVRELADLDVEVHVRTTTAATATVVVVVAPDGERTMLPDRGANLRLEPSDIPAELFVPGAHLHLSGYTLFTDPPRAAGLHALSLARQAGMTVSVDPSSAAPLRTVGSAAFLEWTQSADLCLPNATEALALSGAADLDAAMGHLTRHYGHVVITKGSCGAVWSDGGQQLAQSAPDVKARDTTGAGDAFAAGFLRAFTAGQPPAACLAAAVTLASVAVEGDGARPPAT